MYPILVLDENGNEVDTDDDPTPPVVDDYDEEEDVDSHPFEEDDISVLPEIEIPGVRCDVPWTGKACERRCENNGTFAKSRGCASGWSGDCCEIFDRARFEEGFFDAISRVVEPERCVIDAIDRFVSDHVRGEDARERWRAIKANFEAIDDFKRLREKIAEGCRPWENFRTRENCWQGPGTFF